MRLSTVERDSLTASRRKIAQKTKRRKIPHQTQSHTWSPHITVELQCCRKMLVQRVEQRDVHLVQRVLAAELVYLVAVAGGCVCTFQKG